jgi:hypothetical protein
MSVLASFRKYRAVFRIACAASLTSASLLVFADSKLNTSITRQPIKQANTPKPPSVVEPAISWSQPRIVVTLSPGETLSKDVTFTSTVELTNITFEAGPKIARFLTIEPSRFPGVSANQPQSIRMKFSIASATTLGKYEGTVHVRSGRKTLPHTLKVIIDVAWQSISDTTLGFTINYPVDWSVRQSQGSLVFSSTLAPRSLEGDPGDEIDLRVFPRDDFSTILDWVKERYNGEIEININSVESFRNLFGVHFIKLHHAPDLSSDNINAFAMINDHVIQISITPASQFRDVFEGMLNTFRAN